MNKTKPFHLLLASLLLIFVSSPLHAEAGWPRIAESADGVPISYEVHGSGEPTLVFVHGWSCDGRYWREQVPHFAAEHRVIAIDLAGHGHSGLARESYSMAAFGEDVRAVVAAEGAGQVILIGHSMGGPVSVAAARRMPEQVIGIVGVDTFQATFVDLSAEQAEGIIAPLRADFAGGAVEFVRSMFVDATDAALRDWVVADMAAAPPHVALSAMEELFGDAVSGDARTAATALEVPIVAINADLYPTDVEANQAHMHAFDAVILEGTDHFLHMAEPAWFNRELEAVIANMVEARAAAD